ncbi:hypothetical protein ACKKBG_A14875 [Auxenochlorella protothecoides x Auxenochlorella symbiontica]
MDSRRDSMSSFEHVELAQAAETSHDDTPIAGNPAFNAPARATSLPPPVPSARVSPGPGSGFPPAPRSPGQDPLKEIEEVAERVMGTAVHAAKDVTQLASEAAREAAREARQGLSSLASGFSSWWSTLDVPTEDQGSGGNSADERDAVALAVSLGLEPGEAVLESFPCHLLQTYRSVNGLTPDREVPFPGTLHLTSLNAVFVAGQGAGLPDPVRLPLAAVRASHVTGAAVARPPRGSASAGQRLVLSATIAEGDIAFAGFREGGPESALALLEHLSSSD